MIKYNTSGCPILCFRFCVSIPMTHFDDLKLHNFTHKLIFLEWEIKNFPNGSHFPYLHVYWWGQFLVWLERLQKSKSVWGEHMNIRNVSHQCEILSNAKYVSMRPKCQKPKAYFYERKFSHQQQCNIKSYKGQMHSMVSSQPGNAAHQRQCKICPYEAKIQLQVIKNNTNLATYTIIFERCSKDWRSIGKRINCCWGCKARCWQFFKTFGACLISS